MNDKTEKRQEAAAASKFKAGWKVVAGIAVVVVILLQAFWTMMESRIDLNVAAAQEEFKGKLTSLEERVAETEKGGTLDVEEVKANAESIRKAGEDFEKKLSAIIQAEELKLTALEKNAADQKIYVDELKRLLGGMAE